MLMTSGLGCYGPAQGEACMSLACSHCLFSTAFWISLATGSGDETIAIPI